MVGIGKRGCLGRALFGFAMEGRGREGLKWKGREGCCVYLGLEKKSMNFSFSRSINGKACNVYNEVNKSMGKLYTRIKPFLLFYEFLQRKICGQRSLDE